MWEASLRPSIHMRSSNGTPVVAGLGVLKVSARLVDLLPVTSAALRLTTARLGMFAFEGSGAFTATSPSPPPGANPLELQNGVTNMPQSGWPSYLKGRVPSAFGPPSAILYQRHRSRPPGTPRMDST